MTSVVRMVVAIVTGNDELSLACMTSLLRLQQQQSTRGRQCQLDVHIVPTFLSALNLFDKGDYIVVLDGAAGVPPEFVFGVIDSGQDAVAGVYPLPRIDWDRVETAVKNGNESEPVNHAGLTYNVTPTTGPVRYGLRYVPIDEVNELKVVAIASHVLRRMAGPDLSYEDDDGVRRYLFAHDSVFDNRFHNQFQTFARRLPVPLVADLEAPCIMTGPAQFAGCVGARKTLR